MPPNSTAVILISAEAEWRAVRRLLPEAQRIQSPFGEGFHCALAGWDCIFLHGGWGKIAAAASTQFAIDHFHPSLMINLGTCGGFADEVEPGEIILAEQTVVYDIYEQMGDPEAHIAHYSTTLDLSWLQPPLPAGARRSPLVSGDRDLMAEEIPHLKRRYQAIAGDWESGAIAWTAQRNHIPLLILRGVTDVVDEGGSPAYGGLAFFEQAAAEVMGGLVAMLPDWLAAARRLQEDQK